MIELNDCQRSMRVDALAHFCNSPGRFRQIAEQRLLLREIGRMDDMLFQHDDAGAALGARGIIAGMLLA